MIETGESLWRGDEPSPTRSSVMIRFSNSHIRFGTFERLHYLKRKDLTGKLLDHVIEYYYPKITFPEQGEDKTDSYVQFYAELVQRVAQLTAQWMAAGFCHGVLNTDNMSITGESFDYGPYAFIPSYNPQFTAAYFDYYRRYSYSNQPEICALNLEMLQQPLAAVIPIKEMEAALAKFGEHYYYNYQQLMLNKLGFEQLPESQERELLQLTIQLLHDTQVGYHAFFAELTQQFDSNWRDDLGKVFSNLSLFQSAAQTTRETKGGSELSVLAKWQELYHHILQDMSNNELEEIAQRLREKNPKTALLRPLIEEVWAAITQEDNWEPFDALLRRLQAKN